MLSLKLEEFPSLCEHDTWTTCDRCARPSGGRHHACERGQSSGERPEAVGAGRPGRRPAGRSLAVREQRRQTQEQVLVEKLQGECVCVSALHYDCRICQCDYDVTCVTPTLRKCRITFQLKSEIIESRLQNYGSPEG